MNGVVHANFQERVEVEVQRNQYKVFNITPHYFLPSIMRQPKEIDLQQNLTSWLVDASTTHCILVSNKCLAVVDRSFFLIYPKFISAYWKFVYDRKVIGHGGFVVKVPPHL